MSGRVGLLAALLSSLGGTVAATTRSSIWRPSQRHSRSIIVGEPLGLHLAVSVIAVVGASGLQPVIAQRSKK